MQIAKAENEQSLERKNLFYQRSVNDWIEKKRQIILKGFYSPNFEHTFPIHTNLYAWAAAKTTHESENFA